MSHLASGLDRSGASAATTPGAWARVRRSPGWLTRRAVRVLGAVWLLVLLLLFWEWQARRADSLFFPPVSTIVSELRSEFFSGPASDLFLTDVFKDNVFASLSRAARGWLFASVIGITVGILLGVWRNAALTLNPVIRFGMSVPASVLLPLAVVLFGVTSSMNVFLIAFGSVWVILVNTMDGVRNIDETALVAAKSLRLGRARTFWKVLLPGASPQIFAGIRVSVGISLILMVVSELFAASSGIGYYIVYAQRTFDFDRVWAGVFLLALIGIALNAINALIERRLLNWHIQSRQQHD